MPDVFQLVTIHSLQYLSYLIIKKGKEQKIVNFIQKRKTNINFKLISKPYFIQTLGQIYCKQRLLMQIHGKKLDIYH